jgi:putative acetyltransferase
VASVLIRPVHEDDADAIVTLRRRKAVARYIYAMPSDRVEGVRRFIAGLGPDNHSFVAELDGRVVGMAGLYVRAGKAHHSAWVGLMVHDELHGRGIGRALLERLLDLADRWLGLVRVDLTVLDDNQPARRLYEQLGFVLEGTQRKGSFVDGAFHDVLMMARIRD